MAANSNFERSESRQFIRLNKVIGFGTWKTVYEGLDILNGTKVAWCKIEIPEKIHEIEGALDKLLAEAPMLQSLDHQNIVKCYEHWNDGKHIHIITELCSSGNLRDYILKHDLFGCNSAIKNWCRQILTALQHIHSRNMIHLDVNLGNIFVNGNSGTVKLGDFGVAVRKNPENTYNTALGTPEYRAPEVSSYNFDHLADIHSFGMTVLQMVTYDNIYMEYDDVAAINTAVESRFYPLALNEVGDTKLMRFIQRCIRPKNRRPEASALLNDPFLATTDDDDAVADADEGRQDNRPKPSRFLSFGKLSLSRKSKP